MKNLFNVVVLVGFLAGDICLLGALICGMIAIPLFSYNVLILSSPALFICKVVGLGMFLLVLVFIIWIGGMLSLMNLSWIVDFIKETFKGAFLFN